MSSGVKEFPTKKQKESNIYAKTNQSQKPTSNVFKTNMADGFVFVGSLAYTRCFLPFHNGVKSNAAT